MEKNANAVKKPVQLPEGYMCGYCCGDCIFLDKSWKIDDGRYRCGKTGDYVSGGKSACGSFQKG